MPTTSTIQTIAELLPLAAERHAERPAVRRREADGWRDVSYPELERIVRELALGLVDLGVEPGERVAILASTRAEWTYADLAITAAGGVVVPIYPTNSVAECEWVLRDSGAVAVVCEDEEQVAKVHAARASLPELREVVSIDAGARRDLAVGARRARPRGRSGRARAARGCADGRRRVHVHLHVGHDRAAEGLRAVARQPPRRARRRRASTSCWRSPTT